MSGQYYWCPLGARERARAEGNKMKLIIMNEGFGYPRRSSWRFIPSSCVRCVFVDCKSSPNRLLIFHRRWYFSVVLLVRVALQERISRPLVEWKSRKKGKQNYEKNARLIAFNWAPAFLLSPFNLLVGLEERAKPACDTFRIMCRGSFCSGSGLNCSRKRTQTEWENFSHQRPRWTVKATIN